MLSGDERDADLAALAAELAKTLRLTGATDQAAERVELALEIAEVLELHEVLAQALATKALILNPRPAECEALTRQALKIALEHDLTAAALRAYTNLGHVLHNRDRIDEAISISREALVLARRRGDRPFEWFTLSNLDRVPHRRGTVDRGARAFRRVPGRGAERTWIVLPGGGARLAHVERGELSEARGLSALLAGREDSDDFQDRAYAALALASLARADGDHRTALSLGEKAADEFLANGDNLPASNALAETASAAFALSDLARVDDLLARCGALPPVDRTHCLQAQEARIAAGLAARRDERDRAEGAFRRAAALFRELGMAFWLAVSLFQHGEWLAGEGQKGEADPLLAEAQEIFERLEARPWLERLDAVRPQTEALAG